MKKIIPQATIDRLPLYFRTLKLAEESGIQIISSEDLGQRLDIKPEQIRKDLASFGQFGKKGVGYYVGELNTRIQGILGLDNHWRLAIVGVGHLGAALANYANFVALGFEVAALFDTDERIIGSEINGVKVYDFKKIKTMVKVKSVDIGVIAVPAPSAQIVADSLVGAGVKGIWNFAPTRLNIPEEIPLVNEDLSIGLSALSFHMTQK